MNNYLITVIVPTYNPSIERLNRCLKSLSNQTLDKQFWELIIIDNNSTNDFQLDTSLLKLDNCKIVEEKKQGLTYARLCGFKLALAEIIIMVDDDNILDPDYLTHTLALFQSNPKLGSIGGKSLPSFEEEPPIWLFEFYGSLALRDYGDQAIVSKWENKYPDSSPIGAGMGIRKIALAPYINKIELGKNVTTDRIGNSLSSGGDNDINLEILKAGFSIGYFPQLVLEHIIPAARMQKKYLGRLLEDTNKSWVMLLNGHGISLWQRIPKWSLKFRILKAYFIHGAWTGTRNYLRWKNACGIYKGQAEIT